MTTLKFPLEKLQLLSIKAKKAITDGEYATALQTSKDLNDTLEKHQPTPIWETDGTARPYSIVVVGYRALSEQQPLVDVLLELEQSRFELIFVENSAQKIFAIPEDREGTNVRVIRIGINLGVGIARNVAIKSSTGAGIIMLDDDGLTDEDSIEALIELYESAQATAVRGKVLPKSSSETPPQHYYPGDRITSRYCDIEGLSIWRKSELLRVGMFDPILFGHEGVELTVRLFPYNGPEAFLYQPKAVLWHDFYNDPNKLSDKMARYERLTKYITYKIPHYQMVLNMFSKAEQDITAQALFQHRCAFVEAAKTNKKNPPVSIITTCYNGAEFMADFVEALLRQTDQNFELVFVDDGSEDASADLLEELLPQDFPLKLVRCEQRGRSAALNTALATASHDLCLVADVDDIPVPQRVEWTKAAYSLYPDAAMIGFMIYDNASHARASRPFPSSAIPLSVRGFFGMPAPFPGFSFKKSKVEKEFNESLPAGVDCDWIFRSLKRDGCDGYLIPLNVTYYRLHDGQITAAFRPVQRTTALKYLKEKHMSVLGDALSSDQDVEFFAGWTPIRTGGEYWKVHDYALRLIDGAHQAGTETSRLRKEVYDHLNALHLKITREDRLSLKTLFDRAKNNENTLKENLSTTAAERNDLQRRLDDLQSRLDFSEAALTSMQVSKSWRITSPIRAVGRIFAK